MNSPLSLVFFVLFATIIVWMYLALRRGWMSPGFVLGAGLAGSIVTVLLMSVSQGTQALHAIIAGILIGSIFSLATFGMASYFSRREKAAS
jgi:hypothetical protein